MPVFVFGKEVTSRNYSLRSCASDLKTGRETGRVYLSDHIAGPRVQCTLDVVGTGLNPDGNPTFTYTGRCTFLDSRRGSE